MDGTLICNSYLISQTPLPGCGRSESALDLRRVYGDDGHAQRPQAQRAVRHLRPDGGRGGRGQRALRDGGGLDRPHRASLRGAARHPAQVISMG